MSMFWEFHQQSNIRDAKIEATDASTRATSAQHHVKLLEERVNRLALTCQAMWELLRDHSKLTEEHITKKVMEIDLRDGNADGKMGSMRRKCPECSRALSRQHARCLYCGCQMQKEHQFDV